jgi:hypothetical protein
MGDQTTWGDALPKLKLTQFSVVKRIVVSFEPKEPE